MKRIHLLLFATTLSAAGVLQIGRPARASATITPTPIQPNYCCERGTTRCCGTNWCAILETGCARG